MTKRTVAVVVRVTESVGDTDEDCEAVAHRDDDTVPDSDGESDTESVDDSAGELLPAC